MGIPTETVYGLAANGCDPKAVAGIFDPEKVKALIERGRAIARRG